jgi:glycerol-3-phosphate acyltransferase PlsX
LKNSILEKITIAVDVMGGDYAPEEIIKGTILYLKEINIKDNDFKIILVGNERKINNLLQKYEYDKRRLSVIKATQKIEHDEYPAIAVKEKRDSSLNVCSKLVKDKISDGMVSAGPTGAFVISAILNIGRVKGVKRPAFAVFIPTIKNPVLLLDIGANVDCKPIFLLQFAIMGKILYENLLPQIQPRIGLLSIGEEKTKGNDLVKQSYELISKSIENFIGNVEGHQILSGKANVIVCDGFTGNVILKSIEGTAELIFNQFKNAFLSNIVRKSGAYLLRPALKELKNKFDYREYGGLQLLGINGVCIKAHGRSKAKAIKNSIKVAVNAIKSGMITKIADEIINYIK